LYQPPIPKRFRKEYRPNTIAGAGPDSEVRGGSVTFSSQAHNGFATVRGMKYASQHCCDKTMDNKMA